MGLNDNWWQIAKILTDNWQIAQNLTDNWHLPWGLLTNDKVPDCPLSSARPFLRPFNSIVSLFLQDTVIKCAFIVVYMGNFSSSTL